MKIYVHSLCIRLLDVNCVLNTVRELYRHSVEAAVIYIASSSKWERRNGLDTDFRITAFRERCQETSFLTQLIAFRAL